jgi:hypothetical protein
MVGVIRVLVLAFIGAIFAACAGAASEDGGADSRVDDPAEQSRRFAELRATEEYQVATQRMEACRAERGYVGNPYAEGVSMPDGSVLKLEPGQPGPPLTGAYLDFRLAQQECQQEAGFEEILQKFGLTSQVQGITPGQLALMNQEELARMRCMEAKGWEIPEPVTLQGSLVFDVHHDNPEDEAAWQTDYSECWFAGDDSP